jgi:hypothetical protein
VIQPYHSLPRLPPALAAHGPLGAAGSPPAAATSHRMKSRAGGEIKNSLGRDLPPRLRPTYAKFERFLEKFWPGRNWGSD